MRFPWSRPAPSPAPAQPVETEHPLSDGRTRTGRGQALLSMWRERTERAAPAVAHGAGADASLAVTKLSPWGQAYGDVPEALFAWFAAHGFTGYQMAALIAQHWFVAKACLMPARDAVRHGFTMSVDRGDSDASRKAADKLVQDVEKANRRMRISQAMVEFVNKGRIFGIRVGYYRVDNTDPDYYEFPFNPDSITPGSYRGIVQVDPYWCAPLLDQAATSQPDSPEFYEPTWWQINGRKYHRSHLVIFRTADLPDILRPSYIYGGIPIPQRIMERVYAAERTANEVPQLVLSKRLTTYKTDLAKLVAKGDGGTKVLELLAEFRDNWGVRVVDTNEEMDQLETSLADLDDVVMGQYVLACAAAEVPTTKMLGTAPKGLNATGEYDESSYHESLESIQTDDLDPFLEGHLLRLSRSEFGGVEITADWNPLDSPTAKEYAEIEKLGAETDNILVQAGALDGDDIRQRWRNDRNGRYANIEGDAPEPEPVVAPGSEDDPFAADAEPRSLYVSRKLLNTDEFVAWARSQGFTPDEDLHVTVTYSRAPVDWMLMGDNWSGDGHGNLTVEPGGPRVVERLGDAVVLSFVSSGLSYRHAQMIEMGASWDFSGYQPHVTINIVGESRNLAKVEAYQGKLVFGPELFEPIDDAS